jgi:peptidoglycan/LPS O-acetylase OafA/YrhL
MRIEQITFTRFIAAILIVIFHYGVDIFPFSLNKKMFLGANVGVSYFFILSGFVMIIAYHKRKRISMLEFLRNRFARIYPIYSLALFILLSYYLVGTNVDIKLDEVFLNVFMIQSWIPGKALTLNFPGWSLSVELFFYISFPILFNFLYRKFSLKKLIVPMLLFFVVSQGTFIYLLHSSFYQGMHTISHDLLFYFPVMHLNEFVLGNLLGIYFVSRARIPSKNNAIYIFLLIIICGLVLSFDNAMRYHNGLMGILFVPLIWFVATDNSWIAKFSSKKMMVHLGEISYGVYILQIPVLAISRRILLYFGIENKTSIFYISVFALLIFSSITYKYIETPLRKRIKSGTFAFAKKS